MRRDYIPTSPRSEIQTSRPVSRSLLTFCNLNLALLMRGWRHPRAGYVECGFPMFQFHPWRTGNATDEIDLVYKWASKLSIPPRVERGLQRLLVKPFPRLLRISIPPRGERGPQPSCR